MRYAVIEGGEVKNVIEWDGQAPYSPGENRGLVAHGKVCIGDVHSDGKFMRAAVDIDAPPEPEPGAIA